MMEDKTLVTLITAVYNGEKYVNDFINSVINQDYKNIEFIIVNDGSVDNTEVLIDKRKEDIKNNTSRFLLINKENGGQSSAINAGLKETHGEFISWVDFDDLLEPNYISEKVNQMNSENLDILISSSKIIDMDDSNKILGYTWEKEYLKEELMDNETHYHDFSYEPGNFFIKTSTFFELYPSKHIYDECGIWTGCNIQMTFPMIAYGKIGFYNKPLYIYRLNNQGHHFRKYSIEKEITRMNHCIEIWKSVFSIAKLNLDENKKKQYMHDIEQHSYFSVMNAAWHCKDKKAFKQYYKLREKHTFKEFLKRILINF